MSVSETPLSVRVGQDDRGYECREIQDATGCIVACVSDWVGNEMHTDAIRIAACVNFCRNMDIGFITDYVLFSRSDEAILSHKDAPVLLLANKS